MSDIQNPSNPPARKTITTDSPEWQNSYFMQLEKIRAREKRESQAEIVKLIVEAWERVRPMVENNRDELMARLARRRSRTMSRPPRAWCAAVRANDTRMTPMNAIFVPEHAGFPDPRDINSYREHTITLDAELLRFLCRPVWCDWPYNTMPEIQKKMGWSRLNVLNAYKRGMFEKRTIPRPGGRGGAPVPALYTHRPLDPCANAGTHADVVWGTTIRYVCDHIPDTITQTIQRVPLTSKLPQSRRADQREFMGWRWICPACGHKCKTLYYPLPPLAMVELMKGGEIHRKDAGNPDAISPGHQTFACWKCHNVLFCTRMTAGMWNQIIAHITGGLLYGHEVPRPAWYEPKRKVKYAPRLNRLPAKRRAQVREELERGLSHAQIARKLGMRRGTVGSHIWEIYRQARVKNLKEFRAKFCRSANEASGASAAPPVDSEAIPASHGAPVLGVFHATTK